MNKSIVLGLDLGTTNVKVAAFRINGELVAEASESYPTYYPHPGMAEQSPVEWQVAVKRSLQQLALKLGDQVGDIAALGLSAHAPGFVPVNAIGDPILDRVPIWQDERSYEQGEKLLQAIGPHWIGLGMPFSSFAAKLKWFTETHPDKAKDTLFAIGAKAFLANYLTGQYATDPSSEPGNAKTWERMCDACGWSLTQLPPILEFREVIGEMRSEFEEEIGLKGPIPIVLGLNDGASATLGNGLVTSGEGVITMGTNGVVFLVTDFPVPPEMRLKQAVFCWPYVEGRWIIGGQTKTGAASLQWFVEILQDKKTKVGDFDKIIQSCSTTPAGNNGIMFYPYLMGRGTPYDDPSVTGAFVGLRMQSVQADLIHAVLEGVAFSLREVTDALELIEQNIKRLSITGGGAQSKLWRQLVSDVLNKPLMQCEGDSSLGAAIIAAHGVGIFPTIQSALSAMVPETRTIHPRPDKAALYEELFREYCIGRDALLRSP